MSDEEDIVDPEENNDEDATAAAADEGGEEEAAPEPDADGETTAADADADADAAAAAAAAADPAAEVDAPPPPPPDIPLSQLDLKSGLGGLASVGDGLDYAFTVLNASNKGVTSLAVLTPDFVHLQHVDVSRNKLASLEAVLALPGLISLHAARNSLAAVDLAPLPLLQKASLARNALTALPAGSLPAALRWLDVSHNALASAAALQEQPLPELRFVNLAHNKLGPGLVLALPQLTTLVLDHNALGSLDGLAALPHLEELTARSCGISALPATVWPALRKLDLATNSIEMTEAVKLGAVAPAAQVVVFAENPVADAGDYRLELLVSARALRVLDDIAFEPDELQEAAELRKDRRAAAAAAE